MKRIINFRSVTYVLTLAAFSFITLVSSISADATTLNNSLSFNAYEQKANPADFIFTDDLGNVLDPTEFEVRFSSNKGEIAPQANVVSKTMTVDRYNFGSPLLAPYITVSEPSGLSTPWKGTLRVQKRWTQDTLWGTYYWVRYSGTVTATSR